MSSLVIPIRFGSIVEGRLPLQISKFHSDLLRLSRLEYDEQQMFTTLPISISYEHTASPDRLADEIKRISDSHNCAALLIDVGGPDERDVCRPNIIRGIANAIFVLSESSSYSKIVLFFAVSISDRDVASKFLFPIATAHGVSVIFGDGTGHEIPADQIENYKSEVPKIMRAATIDVVEKFKRKLVRHVGYFSFQHSNEIVPHLFDGADCQDEIYQIVYARMVEAGLAKHDYIYYDSSTSEWLRAPFIEAAKAANLSTKIHPLEAATDCETLLDRNACVYVPIIRTGSAITRISNRVRGLNPGNDTLFYSLLSTRGTQPKKGKRPLPIVSNTGVQFNIDVSYDVLVPDVDGNIQRVWREYRGPKHTEPPLSDWRLSSCATWGMVLEAGLVREEYKPQAREFVGFIPDSGKLAELNGPFIAKKISTILSTKYGVCEGLNVVLVCPKETNALKIVESLRELFGCSYVAISRDVIDFAFRMGETFSMEQLAGTFKDQPEHYESIEQLFNIGGVGSGGLAIENPDVVAFDEFSYSGDTLSGLSRIVAAARLQTLCTICLLDLSGTERTDADFFTLYELDYSRWATGQ